MLYSNKIQHFFTWMWLRMHSFLKRMRIWMHYFWKIKCWMLIHSILSSMNVNLNALIFWMNVPNAANIAFDQRWTIYIFIYLMHCVTHYFFELTVRYRYLSSTHPPPLLASRDRHLVYDTLCVLRNTKCGIRK